MLNVIVHCICGTIIVRNQVIYRDRYMRAIPSRVPWFLVPALKSGHSSSARYSSTVQTVQYIASLLNIPAALHNKTCVSPVHRASRVYWYFTTITLQPSTYQARKACYITLKNVLGEYTCTCLYDSAYFSVRTHQNKTPRTLLSWSN